jgi:uncharacterized MAPEG superfamily protein
MTTKPSPIDEMNEYTGSSFPSPLIPLSGFLLGFLAPYGLVQGRIVTTKNHESAVLTTLQSLGYVSFLFIAEFVLGAMARSTSAKASFSPAAAAATGEMPFELVQANRIHQNHIESLVIFLPSALAAAGAGANPAYIKACVLSWLGFRGLYRLGYMSKNPMYRIAGTAASQVQSWICLWLWQKEGGSKL